MSCFGHRDMSYLLNLRNFLRTNWVLFCLRAVDLVHVWFVSFIYVSKPGSLETFRWAEYFSRVIYPSRLSNWRESVWSNQENYIGIQWGSNPISISRHRRAKCSTLADTDWGYKSDVFVAITTIVGVPGNESTRDSHVNNRTANDCTRPTNSKGAWLTNMQNWKSLYYKMVS